MCAPSCVRAWFFGCWCEQACVFTLEAPAVAATNNAHACPCSAAPQSDHWHNSIEQRRLSCVERLVRTTTVIVRVVLFLGECIVLVIAIRRGCSSTQRCTLFFFASLITCYCCYCPLLLLLHRDSNINLLIYNCAVSYVCHDSYTVTWLNATIVRRGVIRLFLSA